ncbi:MAG TPA: UDPGP type 1 family protein [Candidatus Didemnitutus sp.]|jgi:UDP-N-acetylglucosamine/UDP-N-acetylgalactosamine diphosphorylase
MSHDTLIGNFRRAGQGQVFAFWERLSPSERETLCAQAAEVDLAEVGRLYRTLVAAGTGGSISLEGIRPAPFIKLPGRGGAAADWEQARAAGEDALRAGRVAAFTVAGGQGTRLGYDGPKGTFEVTPVRRKTLFQVFAEKITAAGKRHGKPLHWFIMTSHANHEQTEGFFKEHRFFGFDPGRVHFFRQGRMPAVDLEGRIMLETTSTLALSPDGHGGSLRALHRSGALDLMQSEGIDALSYFQVDNPLVRCIDPAFIGFHLQHRSEMASKMVPKSGPGEKVGHFCLIQDRLNVVEYSDMPAALQQQRNADGSLLYEAGSIAIHIIDREFARRMAAGGEGVALPFHRANKKIATVDANGAAVRPDKANGVKFELFVFDALPFARNTIVVETARADDFSPVKNADGADSPQTCRDDQLRQFARWLRAAGAAVETDATGRPAAAIEVSPLFGDDERSFAESWRKLAPKPAIRDGLYLE